MSPGGTPLELLPFRGLRYDPSRVDLAAVTSAPLEPTNTAQAAAALSRDEHNIAWLLDPLLAGSASPDEGSRVAERLAAWRRKGVVHHDAMPALYAYAHHAADRRLLGLVAAVSLPEPDDERILAHEQVGDAAVTRHVSLLEATSGQPEPVVLVHQASDSFRALLAEQIVRQPTVSFRDGLSEHHLWRLSDPRTIAALTSSAGSQQLLIADGHHRYAAFGHYRDAREHAAFAPWRYGLAMLVDAGDSGLSVDSIHRVVHGLGWEALGTTPHLIVRTLANHEAAQTYLTDVSTPRGSCVITDGARWVAAAPRRADVDASDPSGQLAVTHLHGSWLAAWQVEGTAVDYIPEVVRAVHHARRSGGLAILLPPPPLEVVYEAARQGCLLPPKATSFGPKPRIGLVLRHWPDGLDDLGPRRSRQPITVNAPAAAPG